MIALVWALLYGHQEDTTPAQQSPNHFRGKGDTEAESHENGGQVAKCLFMTRSGFGPGMFKGPSTASSWHTAHLQPSEVA